MKTNIPFTSIAVALACTMSASIGTALGSTPIPSIQGAALPCSFESGVWECSESGVLREWNSMPHYEMPMHKTVTAYNSVEWQTDLSPCLSADGSDVCALHARGDYSCAAAMPFGTRLSIPGFGTCTVRDRLARKYADRVDIHMGYDVAAARKWGKQVLSVSIITE